MTRPEKRIAPVSSSGDDAGVEELIERAEVVALLFNVSDIAASLSHIEEMLGGDDGEEEAEPDGG